ncbi:MAG TPA: hypothetical protein VI321_06915 [Burkholderiales bacterium]
MNGVGLGAGEAQIKKAFPSALCKALEWASRAADRRCDDSKISFGGAEARITFYLKKDVVQAFDLVFDTKDIDKVAAFVKSRYGKPLAEAREKIERQGKEPREVYKVRWEQGKDSAVLVSQVEKKRSQLTVARGNFEEEIYRVH